MVAKRKKTELKSILKRYDILRRVTFTAVKYLFKATSNYKWRSYLFILKILLNQTKYKNETVLLHVNNICYLLTSIIFRTYCYLNKNYYMSI